jgi:hypothetical protein
MGAGIGACLIEADARNIAVNLMKPRCLTVLSIYKMILSSLTSHLRMSLAVTSFSKNRSRAGCQCRP